MYNTCDFDQVLVALFDYLRRPRPLQAVAAGDASGLRSQLRHEPLFR
jgi:hypothetical protein